LIYSYSTIAFVGAIAALNQPGNGDFPLFGAHNGRLFAADRVTRRVFNDLYLGTSLGQLDFG
jgi:hypothetical protein